MAVVERFYSDAIPSEKEGFLDRVIESKGEHPIEFVQAIFSIL